MTVENTTVLWWTAGVNVVAILAAPAVALWIQRKVDRKKPPMTADNRFSTPCG